MGLGPKLYNGVRLVDGPCLPNIARIDHFAMPMISSMGRTGLQVDLSHFAKMEKELIRDLEKITEDVHVMTGKYVNLASGDQVAQLLFKDLGLKQARVKMTTSGSRESVEDEVLTAIQHDHPVVPKILEYKEFDKLRGTYVAPMPKLARRTAFGTWRMFPNFRTTRVPSGRLSCTDPNLLAMPTRTKRGKQIREGFITDPGWVYVSVDESQIEPRIGAHRSKDPALLNVYRNNEDIYSDFATAAFRLKDERYRNEKGKWIYPTVDPDDHRRPSKTCVLASIYDVTGAGLLEQMPIICANCGKPTSVEDDDDPIHDCAKFRSYWHEGNCQDLINAFYMKYPGLLRMRKLDHARLRKHGYLWDMFGRILHGAAKFSVLEWVVSAAMREAANFPLQCLSKDSTVFQEGQGYKKLGDLVDQKVTLWDGQEWSTGEVVNTGVKKQIRIVLQNEQEISCSPDHRILIGSPEGEFSWKTAAELEHLNWLNMRVCIGGQIKEEWNWLKTLPDCPHIQGRDKNPQCDLSWGLEDPALFGEMLGRIASDGNIGINSRDGKPKSVTLIVAQHEEEILPFLTQAVRRTAGKYTLELQVKRGISKKGIPYRPLHHISIHSRGLAELLLNWQIKDRIPSIVWNNSTLLCGYLRGFFDGDGGVIGVGKAGGGKGGGTVSLAFGSGTKKAALAKEIQQALLLFGIRSRVHSYSQGYGCTRLVIRQKDLFYFQKHIGFMNSSKNKKLQSVMNYKPVTAAYGRAISIKTMERLTDIEMVDFVDSTTGRFCANGMVVHNSSAQGTIKITMAMVMDELESGNDLEVVHPLLQVHDELIFECREDVAEELGLMVSRKFETCVPLDVPIKAGIAMASTWGTLPK